MVPWHTGVRSCRTVRQACTTVRFAVEDNERVVQHYALIIAKALDKQKLQEREEKARLSQHTSVEMTWFSKDTRGSRWVRNKSDPVICARGSRWVCFVDSASIGLVRK